MAKGPSVFNGSVTLAVDERAMGVERKEGGMGDGRGRKDLCVCEGELTFPPAVLLLIITYSDSSLRPSLRSQLTGVRAHVPTPCCESARNCERIVRDCGRLRCPRLRTRWSWSSQELVAEGREVRRPSQARN